MKSWKAHQTKLSLISTASMNPMMKRRILLAGGKESHQPRNNNSVGSPCQRDPPIAAGIAATGMVMVMVMESYPSVSLLPMI